MDSPVQFTNQIRAICLPTSKDNFAGSTATVIGWGSLRESSIQGYLIFSFLIRRKKL